MIMSPGSTFVGASGTSYNSLSGTQNIAPPDVRLALMNGWLEVLGLQTPLGPASINVLALVSGSSTSDAVITSGQNTVTSASANFSLADVGKLIVVTDPANFAHVFTGTISGVSSSTTAIVNATSSATIASGGQMYWGFDNYAALSAGLAASTGLVTLGAGIFMLSKGVIVPDGTTLQGADTAFTSYNSLITTGTILVAAGAASYPTSYVVQVGVTTTKSGNLRASLTNLTVEGMNLAQYGVYQHGVGSETNFCAIRRGTSAAMRADATIGKIVGCAISQQITGFALYLDGVQDFMVLYNYIHGAGGSNSSTPTANLYASDVFNGDVLIQGNHFFQESPLSSNTPARNIWMNSTASLLVMNIQNNIFDCTYGHQIYMATTASTVCEQINIHNNLIFENDANFPNATFDFVNVSNLGVILGLSIKDNAAQNLVNTNSLSNIYNPTGAGTFAAVQVANNVMLSCNAVAPAGTVVDGGMQGNVLYNSSSTLLYSTQRGRSTQNGNGSTTAFNIAHGLSDTPQTWSVTPRVALAAPAFVVTPTLTNLVVTYATAPPTGTGNVDLQWFASL